LRCTARALMFRTSPKDYPFGNRPLRLYVRTVRIPLSFGLLKYLLLDLSTYLAPSVALTGPVGGCTSTKVGGTFVYLRRPKNTC
jgi:hypothetical protein